MKKILILLLLGLAVGAASPSHAQLSTFTVEFMITFSAQTQRYTAWVVPNYSTPNTNNSNLNELGATAQFSIRVPREFILSNIVDVRGNWEKNPLKLQTNLPVFTNNGITVDSDYYVIGKAPQETNYGPFSPNVAVALFTFQGNSANANIAVVENSDPFVSQAVANLSLNVASSFYSRSGQSASGNANPLEQFKSSITFEALQSRISGNTGGSTGGTGGSTGGTGGSTGGTGGSTGGTGGSTGGTGGSTGGTGGSTGGTGGSTGGTGGSTGGTGGSTGGTGGSTGGTGGNTGGTGGSTGGTGGSTGGTGGNTGGIVLGVASDLLPGQIFPNPTHDFLTLQGLSRSHAPIQLLDMLGRQVYANGDQDLSLISVQALQPGTYLIRIQLEDRYWIGKFQKVK